MFLIGMRVHYGIARQVLASPSAVRVVMLMRPVIVKSSDWSGLTDRLHHSSNILPLGES